MLLYAICVIPSHDNDDDIYYHKGVQKKETITAEERTRQHVKKQPEFVRIVVMVLSTSNWLAPSDDAIHKTI
eukprot:scaffold293372_cov16-Prasinocladus_malaysianus.AAC.1